MARWRSFLAGLLLAALVACGTATTTSNRSLADPTPTIAPRGPAAPTTSASAPATPPASATPTAPPAPRASSGPAATATAPATARTPTRATVGALPQPNGAIPAGWKVYRGSAEFPFVIAYPLDWTADDSLLPEQRIVFFHGPGGPEDAERIDLEISQTGTGANIDVQRDEFFREESEFCEKKGIEYTEHRQVAGVTFAILGATCDASNDLTFMQVASGLKNGDEWNILMRTHYARKDARLREVFNPMLASLNIYAKAP